MPRQINEDGLNALMRFEGEKLVAYQDSVGVWTIGFGSTRGVRPGMRITHAQALQRLRDDLEPAESAVERLVQVGLTDGQFAALVSFVFNVGEGTFAKSTLLKKLNARNYDAVPAELLKFSYAKGRKLPGLANRRAAEAGLWARGSFVTTNTVTADKTPVGLLSAENVAGGAGTVATLMSAVSDKGPLSYVMAAVILGSFVLAAYFVWSKYIRA